MKGVFRIIGSMVVMALFPAVSGAVGTYYNGNLYQNPQQRYSRSGSGYYNSYGYGSGRNYGDQQNVQNTLGSQKQQARNKKSAQSANKQGFKLDAGLSHQMAKWEFDMNTAGSKLHYDNLGWNVFDAQGTYYFGDSTKMQVKAGLLYGMQFGESPMIDDDVTNSESALSEYGYKELNGVNQNYHTWVSAISTGVSKGGNQMGFNVGFGLTDFFSLGRAKITPSVGFRYFKHKLTTENNKGVAVQVYEGDNIVNCLETQPGEMQCEPFVGGASLVYDATTLEYKFEWNGGVATFAYAPIDIDGNGEADDIVGIYLLTDGSNPTALDLGETYYYKQAGTSHKYETTWMGPYLALDMEYQINNDNLITAGIEFGLPLYKSEGTQPYRWDWKQSPSVEDEGGFGDAYHIGLNMNWNTAITDSTMFTLGLTYDYYSVSGATAKTYLDPDGQYVRYLMGSITADEYNAYEAAGWVIEEKDEVNSVYKSMGIRAGINIRF